MNRQFSVKEKHEMLVSMFKPRDYRNKKSISNEMCFRYQIDKELKSLYPGVGCMEK